MDSKLFVNDLLSVYQRYARLNNLTAEVLTQEDGHAILKVSGKGVGKSFQWETGRHVVQRVPPTERFGRRQTSVISVAVLPLPPENSPQSLRNEDLEIICQTGHQKAGGRNANCVNSAVRMKHKPTGLSVFINGRDQGKNKKEALRVLTAKVNQQKADAEEYQYSNQRSQELRGGVDRIGSRGGKIRTYNFILSEVTDHRLGKSTKDIKSIMKGNLQVLLG